MRKPWSCKMTEALGVATVCVLVLLLVPYAAAQRTYPPPIDNPVIAAYDPVGDIVEAFCGQSGSVVCGQQFSIGGGGAYVDYLKMELAYSSSGYNPCTFTMLITDSVVYNPTTGAVSYGTIFLQRNEPASLDNTSGNFLWLKPVSDDFLAVWLPAGTYYLVMQPGNCDANTSNLTSNLVWVLDRTTSSTTMVGTVGSAYTWNNPVYPDPVVADDNFSPALSKFSFELAGPVLLAPTGGGLHQIARLVAGTVTPLPGGPLQAQIGFVNAATGNLLAPLTPVTLNPGQTESVDLNLTPFVSRLGQRIEVEPVIVQSPNAPGAVNPGPVSISASVQMLDAVTGFGTVLAPMPQPGASAAALGPQILAGEQTMRFSVVAGGPDPCVGQVGFNDHSGNPLAPSIPVNLTSGTGTTVDLKADTLALSLGQQIEVQPVITANSPAAAVALNSYCQASVAVFDNLTGRTWTYQSTQATLPAVQ